MTRQLYIIRGFHNTFPLSDDQETLDVIALRSVLLECVARECGTANYFCDSITAAHAQVFNKFIDESERKTPPINRATMLRKIKERGIKDQSPFMAFELPPVLALRYAGVQLRFAPTEDVFDQVEYLQGRVPDAVYQEFRERQKQPNFHPYDFYDHPLVTEVLVERRDRGVFENVCRYGIEKNILFMGDLHPLRDFDERTHDFDIIPTRIVNTDDGHILVQIGLKKRQR